MRKKKAKCSLCDRDAWSRGWCRMHYRRWNLYGDPTVTKGMPLGDLTSDNDKLGYFGWNVVQRNTPFAEGPCWEWRGNKFPKGYGRFPEHNTTIGAHIVAYRTWVGPIPEGMVVRHKCDNPPCINPEHLELGTVQDNVNDRVTRGRQSRVKTRATLSPETVRCILHEHRCGVPLTEIARRHPETGYSNIWMIVHRKTWTDIEEEQN